MNLHVPLDQTVRPRFRHTYEYLGATVTLTAQSAIIRHPDSAVVESIRSSLLGAWLPDGMYVGTPTGTYKKIGPDE